VKEESDIDSSVLTRPLWCVTRMAKSKGSSQEIPMNSGIIRKALTTTLTLELEYQEPSIFRETGTKSEPPTEVQHPGRLFEDDLHTS